MDNFIRPVQLRWSDMDPNFHVRHSAYYDFGALVRIDFLQQTGLTPEVMLQHHLGPIIFREEGVFKKELRMNDAVTIDLELAAARRDYSRWTLRHKLIKNETVLCAIITVDSAWFDTSIRKLATSLPPIIQDVFEKTPKADNFQWTD